MYSKDCVKGWSSSGQTPHFNTDLTLVSFFPWRKKQRSWFLLRYIAIRFHFIYFISSTHNWESNWLCQKMVEKLFRVWRKKREEKKYTHTVWYVDVTTTAKDHGLRLWCSLSLFNNWMWTSPAQAGGNQQGHTNHKKQRWNSEDGMNP